MSPLLFWKIITSPSKMVETKTESKVVSPLALCWTRIIIQRCSQFLRLWNIYSDDIACWSLTCLSCILVQLDLITLLTLIQYIVWPGSPDSGSKPSGWIDPVRVWSTIFNRLLRRKIRLIECNSNCCCLKIEPQKELCCRCFICLRPPPLLWPPTPRPNTLYTCVRYTYSHWEGGRSNQREGLQRQ